MSTLGARLGPLNLRRALQQIGGSPAGGSSGPSVPPGPVIPVTPAPRVPILDAYYSVGDATYVGKLKTAHTDKSTPFPGTNMPGNSTSSVAVKVGATTVDSPPLMVDYLSGTVSSITLTVSYDSTNGEDGTWTAEPDFALYRPNNVTDNSWGSRGQRYFFKDDERPRWIKATYVCGASAVSPMMVTSSGNWIWVTGMSLFRSLFSGSGWTSCRAAYIAAVPGSDPFFFVSARSGANQANALTEQVAPVEASPTLRRFLRAAIGSNVLADIAFAGVRPYSAQTQATIDGIVARYTDLTNRIKAIVPYYAADCSYGNYKGTDTPLITPGVFDDANGNHPYILNALRQPHKALQPESFDPAYDWPWVSDYAGGAAYADTEMADSVHRNGTGYIRMRNQYAPLCALASGQKPAANTMQTLVTGLGASTTTALKTRMLALFDAMVSMYPTADSTATANRATLRTTLNAIPAT